MGYGTSQVAWVTRQVSWARFAETVEYELFLDYAVMCIIPTAEDVLFGRLNEVCQISRAVSAYSLLWALRVS